MSKEPRFAGVAQLSLRSLCLGALGSCLITASSMYIALKMSALPWPTIFVAVLSMALLKALGHTTLNEINITQTAMSAGAMVAGGLAFTLPGLWISGAWQGPSVFQDYFWPVLGVALSGMVLGTALTWALRVQFIERQRLPYPIGVAAAETLKIGDSGGLKSLTLFGTMAFSAVFTYLRDSAGWIPPAFSSAWLAARHFYIGIWVSPMAVGIGYIIGTLYTGVWFLGALLAYMVIIPFGPRLQLFSSVDVAVAFKNTAGIGLMVGTGVGVFLAYLRAEVSRFRQSNNRAVSTDHIPEPPKTRRLTRLLSLLTFVTVFWITIACGLSPLVSLLLLIGVLAASAMAATITGETGINPMEVFGIIILIAIRLVTPLDATAAFFVAATVAVACGYSGDLLNDYKAGQMLETNPIAQLISQLVGGIVGTVVAVLAMFAIIAQAGGVGPDHGLPAGQAFAVSQMVSGIGEPAVFITAMIGGAALYLLRVPVMTLGIGMYLPFEISVAVFLGGVIRLAVGRSRRDALETGTIAASGLLGGEGVTGVSIAIFKMITGG